MNVLDVGVKEKEIEDKKQEEMQINKSFHLFM